MSIFYFFILPYSSTCLIIALFSLFILQKQAGKYVLVFIFLFYISNSFFLKSILGFGIIFTIIHNLILISLAYVITAKFKVYGLTGQICSGKSFVSNYLRTQYGVSIISIDDLNKRVLEIPKVKLAVRKLFGDEVFIRSENDDLNETLDKEKIKKLIYENPEKKRKLERITHFRVFILFFKLLVEEKLINQNRIVIIENAILLRFFIFRFLCYKIISICVNDQNKLIERIMHRDNCDREMAESIIKNQMSVHTFERGSDVVIYNDGSESQFRDKIDKLIRDIAKENN